MIKFTSYLTESSNSINTLISAKSNSIYISNPKNKERYEEAIDFFIDALKKKEIYNSDFGERYTYGLARGLEDGYKTVYDKMRADVKKNGDDDKAWDIWSVNVAGIKKTIRTFKTLNGKYPEAEKFLNNVEGLSDTIKELKSYIVKGRKPKEADPNAFVKPMAKGDSIKFALKFFNEAVDSFKKEYEASVTKYVNTAYKKVKPIKTVGELKKLSKSSIEAAIAGTILFRDMKAKERDALTVKDNADVLVKRMIDDTVTQVISSFVDKNSRKVALIFEKKNGIKNHKINYTRVNGNALENSISFTFNDNSAFTIKSQVVIKYSQLGKLFAQFPTRFTDVTLADGSKMGMPSEEKMIKDF